MLINFFAISFFVNDLDNEEKRTVREGLDEENLALFDLLLKPGLSKQAINKKKKFLLNYFMH